MDVPIYPSDCCSLERGGLRPTTWPWAVELERGRIDRQTEDIFTNKTVQNSYCNEKKKSSLSLICPLLVSAILSRYDPSINKCLVITG